VLSPATAWFAVLVSVCIVAPYLLGVRPRSRQEWNQMAMTIAFLAWILPLMVSLLA
jgi:hypothetical protein